MVYDEPTTLQSSELSLLRIDWTHFKPMKSDCQQKLDASKKYTSQKTEYRIE